MTPEELILKFDARNRADMHAAGIDSAEVLGLMNRASLSGFKIGADTATSMIAGQLTLMKAKLPEGKS